MPFVDDATIADDEQLLRRIYPDWIVPDYNKNCWRPTSAAFQDSRDKSPMSVHLTSELNRLGLPITNVLAGHEGYGLVWFTAQLARSLALAIVRDPQGAADPAHALVAGKKTEAVRKKLEGGSQWAIPQDKPLPPEGA